jgi:lipoate-protein ligase B
MSTNLDIKDCGIIDYSACLDLQLQLLEQRQAEQIGNTVIFAEHPAVITLGARQEKNTLLLPLSNLQRDGINVVEIRRGGGATAHNIGQIVMYPILSLKQLQLGISDYVRQLEQIGIDLLQKYNVDADRKKGFPGLWIGEEKIASIGVQVKKWITFHGIAINISNDLSIFNKIVPCGLQGVKMTSVLEQTRQAIDMGIVKDDLRLILSSFWCR